MPPFINDRLDERNELCFQMFKDRGDLGHGSTPFINVYVRIIGLSIRIHMFGPFYLQLDKLFKNRGKILITVFLTGFRPNMVTPGSQLGDFLYQFPGNFCVNIIIALGFPDIAPFHIRKRFGASFEQLV